MSAVKMKCPCCDAILTLKRVPINKRSIIPCPKCLSRVPFADYKTIAPSPTADDKQQTPRPAGAVGGEADKLQHQAGTNNGPQGAAQQEQPKQKPQPQKSVVLCPHCGTRLVIPDAASVKNKRFICGKCKKMLTIDSTGGVGSSENTPPNSNPKTSEEKVNNPAPEVEKVKKVCPECHAVLSIRKVEGIENKNIVCAKCHNSIPYKQLRDPRPASDNEPSSENGPGKRAELIECECPHCHTACKLPKTSDVENKKLSCPKCGKSATYADFMSGKLSPIDYQVLKCGCHSKSDLYNFFLFSIPKDEYEPNLAYSCTRCKRQVLPPKKPDLTLTYKCEGCGSQFFVPEEYRVIEGSLVCPTCNHVVRVEMETLPGRLISSVGRIVPIDGSNPEGYQLKIGENVIGRYSESSTADIRLRGNDRMSRQHLIIKVEKVANKVVHTAAFAKKQCNPVKINSQLIVYGEEVFLNNNDIIELPGISVKFVVEKV